MIRSALSVACLGVLLARVSCEEESRRNVFGQCILPLGMEEGKIPDDAITASSSYETKSVGPQNARIRQEKNGGAWCPKAQISSAIREYLEIDLTRNHLIAWTETQGRFGNGQGQEYAEAFFLEYWRDAKWHRYKNLRGDRVLRGNSNTYLVEKQKLDLPFVASRVRFVPYSQHPRTVCMRVEIYGCIWEQYTSSYSAPKASSIGPAGCDVQDSSYDGVEIDSLLLGGLGQLTDGILGKLSEIRSSPTMGGTNWVGWSERATIELVFRFQELRQFENCTLHVARIPELEVETFSTARILFSIDGEKYEPEEEKLDVSIDASSSIPDTVSISVHLQSKIGRLVKVELSLAAKWLLLSEVTFSTGSRNRSSDSSYSSMDSVDSVDSVFRPEQNQSRPREAKSGNSIGSIAGFNETGGIFEIREDDDSTPDAFPVGSSQTYIGLVSGLLTVVVLFLTCTAFLIKQRGRNKVALLQKHTAALLCDSSTPGIAIAAKDGKLSNSIANGLSLIRKPIVIAAADTLSSRTGTEARSQSTDFDFDSNRRRSTLYETTYKLFCEEALVLADSNVSDFKSNSSFTANKLAELAELATPNVITTATTMATTSAPKLTTAGTTATYSSRRAVQLQSRKVSQRIHEGYYAATDILTIKKRELLGTQSPFTPLRIREAEVDVPRTIDPYAVPRVSRHRLRILDKLGEGNFGLVHLCEVKGIASSVLGHNGGIHNRQTVIVRSLWRGVVESIRLDFAKDMHVLATLENPNVAKMMALVEEEPFGAVFEYGQLGDLPTFLENYRFCDSSVDVDNGNGSHASGPENPLNFVSQIASAMRYLESVNIAHCDLAARNCIVDHKLTVKVSDHAMYCKKYDRHYFVDGSNVKIPLRWMAWEAAVMGVRSCRTDVWSFAVTVWEIYTSCKEIPYADLTSAQLLRSFRRWYGSEAGAENGADDSNDERNPPRVPPQPDRCPDDVYRAMNRCWSKRVEDRPNFEEIHRYFERLLLD